MLKILMFFVFGWAFSVSCFAASTAKTSYTYYVVKGRSASEILQSLSRKGPHVNGAGAYASTEMRLQPMGKFTQQGAQCRMSDVKLDFTFTIRLPKLATEGNLDRRTARAWSKFKVFLKTHEETHRAKWLACGRDYSRKVLALRAPDCGKLASKAVALMQTMRKSCNKEQAAFDAAQRKPLMQHPLVQMMLFRQ